MRVWFEITKANDKRYEVWYWCVLGGTILICVLGIYFKIFTNDKPITLFGGILFAIMLLGLVASFFIRYFFDDHIKIGELVFRDAEVIIYRDDVNTKKIIPASDIKEITFNYTGFHGATGTASNEPIYDGTGNIITFINADGTKDEVNIFLEDRDDKEYIVKTLKKFTDKNSIKCDLRYFFLIIS